MSNLILKLAAFLVRSGDWLRAKHDELVALARQIARKLRQTVDDVMMLLEAVMV